MAWRRRKTKKCRDKIMTQRLGAEFLGTFWLVLGGCGSAVLAAAFPDVGIGVIGVSLAFGLTLLTMAFAIGHISGSHLNPARSTGVALFVGGWAVQQLWLFWIAPIIGGVPGGLFYRWLGGNDQ
jgi:aquaporin Z